MLGNPVKLHVTYVIVSRLTFLSLSFLMYKMEKKDNSSYPMITMRIKQDNTCDAFRRIPGVEDASEKCC